jgi:Carboxypeptidase regulatory-like domain
MTAQHQHDSLVGARFSASPPGRTSRARAIFIPALALVACALVAPSLFGDCKCHHPEKGDSTRPGGNMFIVQQEEKPYRKLEGRVELHEDRPLEEVLVEVFDQPEYLLKNGGNAPNNQKRLASCVTSEDGKFCFRHLPPGKYELRASSNAGVNVTHVYVVVDKRAGQTKELVVGMSVGT